MSQRAGRSTYRRLSGWRSKSIDQYASWPDGEVTISSGQTAVPEMNTCSAPSKPLPVGSEKSRATLPSRRTLSAFWAKAIDVVTRNVSSSRRSVAVGQTIGVPSRPRVANSQVR